MPNWCSNKLTLSHDDPEQILRVLEVLDALTAREDAEDAEDEDCSASDSTTGLLGAFLPMPTSIAESKVEVKNERGYSEPAWYVWAEKNWGTKWDVFSAWLADDEDSPNNANRVTIGFRTAWVPPVPWLRHMGQLGFTYTMRFDDYGGDFAGVATNDNTKRIDLSGSFAHNSPAFARVFGQTWQEYYGYPDDELSDDDAAVCSSTLTFDE